MRSPKVFEAKPWLCFFFLTLFPFFSWTQENFTIKGKVVDESGEPLPYARILELNKSENETLSNLDGSFSLTTPFLVDSIGVTYVGYLPIKIQNLNYEKELEISLILPVNEFSEVLDYGETSLPQLEPEKINIQKIIPLDIAVIEVRAFMQNPLGSNIYPVSEIGTQELESTNSFSIQDALNQIPGVKMDSRGYNGSRRLNLRGTIARSPFGVRNVRMKINGFSITSSDGASALELLEPADIQSMTIYKGPSGSFEMPGTGGVISTQLKKVSKPLTASAEFTYGDFDFMRTHVSAGVAKQKFSARISAVYSENKGYRDQEENFKKQITLTANYKASKKLNYDILGILYDGYWELPGHITLEDLNTDPTKADPDSEDMNAHVARRRAYIGIHQEFNFNDRIWNDTWVFGHFSDKLNPYGTHPVFFQGFKDEISNEIGGRTEFSAYSKNYKWKVKAGSQWQNFYTEILEFNNILGEKGTLKYKNTTAITEGLFFASAEYKMNEKFATNVQLGYNIYALDNKGVNPNIDSTLDYKISNSSHLLPRAGISYKFCPRLTTSLSYSQGVGFPSIFEWVDTGSGLFSSSLKPETSDNLELGLKGKLNKGIGQFDWSTSFYLASVKRTITERENTEGNTFYVNNGSSNQLGAEAQVSYLYSFDFEKSLNLYSTLTLNDYQIKNDTGNTSLFIAGIPRTVIGFGVRGTFKALQLDVNGRNVSQITTTLGDELNDETDYLLLNAKISYRFNRHHNWRYAMELGVNNLLDQTYTSFYRLNATGTIYNPMAGQNFYAGLKINFN